MPIYYTKQGKEAAVNKLQVLMEDLKRIREEKAIAYTASGDTWHDNPGFNELEQSEQRKIKQIMELEKNISESVVCDVEVRNVEKVAIGSIALYEKTRIFTDGREEVQRYVNEIGGYGETDTSRKIIGYNSPIGKILIGMEPGEVKEDFVGGEEIRYHLFALYENWDMAKQADLSAEE